MGHATLGLVKHKLTGRSKLVWCLKRGQRGTRRAQSRLRHETGTREPKMDLERGREDGMESFSPMRHVRAQDRALYHALQLRCRRRL